MFRKVDITLEPEDVTHIIRHVDAVVEEFNQATFEHPTVKAMNNGIRDMALEMRNSLDDLPFKMEGKTITVTLSDLSKLESLLDVLEKATGKNDEQS